MDGRGGIEGVLNWGVEDSTPSISSELKMFDTEMSEQVGWLCIFFAFLFETGVPDAGGAESGFLEDSALVISA